MNERDIGQLAAGYWPEGNGNSEEMKTYRCVSISADRFELWPEKGVSTYMTASGMNMNSSALWPVASGQLAHRPAHRGAVL
jgi:hypothetical protein